MSAYNRPLLLSEGLSSVTRQTYRNLEILVQDDSTNDECGQVVRAFDDERIHYVRNVPPLGTMGNLRSGYRQAKGRYLCTLNDDDLYHPTYVEKMVQALETHPDCCLAFADHFIIDSAGRVDEIETDVNSARFRRRGLEGGVISPGLRVGLIDKSVPGMFAMYRREVLDLEDFPDEVSSGYDFWLIYLATRSNQPIFYSPEKLTSYRVHAASQTSSFADAERRLKSLAYDLFMTKRMASDANLRSIHRDLKQRLAEIQTSLGSAWLRLDNRGNAVKSFVNSLKAELNWQAAAGLLLAFAPQVVLHRVLNLRQTASQEMR